MLRAKQLFHRFFVCLMLSVITAPANGFAALNRSFVIPVRSGGQIAFISDRDENYEIYIMNSNGTNQRNLTSYNATDFSPVWSPDGTQIAFQTNRAGTWDIYIMNVDGTNLKPLASSPKHETRPHWSPDGKEIVFTLWQDSVVDVYVINIDTGNLIHILRLGYFTNLVWSPDRSHFAFSSERGDIYIMRTDGSDLRNLTNSITEEYQPTWSPNGKKIAFISKVDGNMDIYIMDVDGTNRQRLTDSEGWEMNPAWSPDGTQIAFSSSRDRNWEIYVMNSDGSNQQNLTNSPASRELEPAWRP